MPQKEKSKQKPRQAYSAELLVEAKSSPVLQLMMDMGAPMTRETYVYLSHLGAREIEDLGAEELAEIPSALT